MWCQYSKVLMSAVIVLLSFEIEVTAEVLLTRDGEGKCTIVTGKDATEAEKYAADELQTHIKQMSGCKLELKTGGICETPMILVGPSEALDKVEPELELESMGKEELVIRTKGPHLILAGGRPRGTLYAVYEFLEKYLGCRWYTRNVSYIPKKAEIKLDEIDYRYEPPFMYRETLYQEAYYPVFAERQRLNGGYNPKVRREMVGGSVVIMPYVHTFHYLVPPNQYFEAHPEYFSLIDGKRVPDKQLCLTNPDVLRIATEKVFRWIERHPEVVIFSVSQNDCYGPCQCEKCQAIVKEEGTEMAPILRFVNAIAKEVGKKYPDKYIETLSYAYSETPTKITKPRDNVIIRLCHWSPGCNVHGIRNCPTNATYRKELKGWKKLAKNIFIWDYMVTFHEYLAAFPNWWAIGQDTRYYADNGVNGVMWQGNHKSLGGEMSDLRTYITAQMLWNPYQDVDKVIDDFLEGFYGPAAKPIRDYLKMVRAYVVEENICRNRKSVKLTPDMMARATRLFENAKKLAPSEEIRNRVKKAAATIQYQQLCDPKHYGLDKEQAFGALVELEKTVARENISHFRESRNWSMEQWLSECEKKLKELYKD